MEDGYINLLSAARRAEEGGGGSPLLVLIREDRWQMGSYHDRRPTTLDRLSTILALAGGISRSVNNLES